MANRAQSRRGSRHKSKYDAQFNITSRNKAKAKAKIARRKLANPCPPGREGVARQVRRKAMRLAGIPKPWTLERQNNPVASKPAKPSTTK
jgi:hypothetical protein